MHARWLLVGLALSVVAGACSPNAETTVSSVATQQTIASAPQPVRSTPAAASSASTTDAIEPARNVVPITRELPLGGPVPPGAPDIVADRVPLPYCGATLLFPTDGVNPFVEIEVSGDAADCYRNRADRGLPAELIEIGSTVEGDPTLVVRRILPDGREEVFSDLTRDTLGTQAWFRRLCPGYGVENCEPSERLAPGERASPESTLFEIVMPDSEFGPPFYVTADRVASSRDGNWAFQRITITSEWRTPIAIAAPPRYILRSGRIALPQPYELIGGAIVVIQPGDSVSFSLMLGSVLRAGPAPGLHIVEVPIAYWSDVDPVAGPAGLPEDTLRLRIEYQVLDARRATVIAAFCEEAVVAAADLAEFDHVRLLQGLEAAEAAAEQLPPLTRDRLLAETATLRRQMEQWFGPTPGHGGFSTTAVVEIINRLCSVEMLSVGVQA